MRSIETFLILFIICSATGCMNNIKVNVDESTDDSKFIEESTETVTDNLNVNMADGSDSEDYVFPSIEISNGNIYSWDTEVQFEDVFYKIEDIQFTQQLGNHEKNDVNYLTDEVDENGNLLNDNYFAWIKLKCKNLSQEKKEIMVNYPFSCVNNDNSDNYATEVIAEAVYISEAQSSRPDLLFQYYLEADEEVEVELGYWIDGNTVDGTLCYIIGYSGSQLEYADNCFMNVEEFWDAK